MTPATMWARLAGTLLAVTVVVLVVSPEVIVVVARAVGLVVCAGLIWWYHRNADWKGSAIGRGTMAIKAGIFAIALAANLNTVNDHIVAHDLEPLAHRCLAGAWLLMAIALVFRLVIMRRIQAQGNGHIVATLRPKE